MAQTSMLHVRVNDKLKTEAAEKLAEVGLTVSDAVRILLTRIAKEGGLPAGLTTDPKAYEHGFGRRCERPSTIRAQQYRIGKSSMKRKR